MCDSFYTHIKEYFYYKFMSRKLFFNNFRYIIIIFALEQ